MKPVQRDNADFCCIVIGIEIDAERDASDAVNIIVERSDILKQCIKSAVFADRFDVSGKALHAVGMKCAFRKELAQLHDRADIMLDRTEPLNQLPDCRLPADHHGAVIEREPQ